MTVTREDVVAALGKIVDPGQGKDLIAAGMAKAISVTDGSVSFVIEVDPAKGAAMEPIRAAAQAAVEQIPGVTRVSAILTAHSDTPTAPAPKGPPPEFNIGRKKPEEPADKKIPGVDHIIAIASGKGGVGKSTVTANLAVALTAAGKRVGLLDADVYGPSQPRMLGISGRPSSPDGKIILPLRNHGVTTMSIGFMVPEGEAVIWRGPMLMGALTQFLTQVQWGRLDVLLIDLPPGTGDVQLTLSQKAEVTGAIIVSTPQDVALLDARKALDMFKKTDTPVLGLIENMSTYICPSCGHEAHIFGHGGAKDEASKLGLPFLGEIPLDLEIRVAGDSGASTAVCSDDSGRPAQLPAIAQGRGDPARHGPLRQGGGLGRTRHRPRADLLGARRDRTARRPGAGPRGTAGKRRRHRLRRRARPRRRAWRAGAARGRHPLRLARRLQGQRRRLRGDARGRLHFQPQGRTRLAGGRRRDALPATL
jgi:ATP-binding protein involved in chromosome partitioning